jgi:hypothetical protein
MYIIVKIFCISYKNETQNEYILYMSNKFTILPSTSSMVFEMTIVLISFLFLNVYIIYLASYDSGYKPNFVMLLNFIFDDPTSLKNFKTYIKNVAIDEVASLKTKESFENKDENVFSQISFSLNKFLLKLFVNGNKISTTKSI